MTKFDEYYMYRALDLARRGENFVSPNPMVGTVLVKNKKIIAEGFHRRFGEKHAEMHVLVLKNARGATLYVNLEPCIHLDKKTPPCVPEIIRSGIARVVVGMKDPNPKVNGKGIEALKKAGITVTVGCLEKEALRTNEKFVKWMTTGMPFVAMKVAMSLDGKIATKTRESKWITGDASRAYVKKLRDQYDAILIGKNTVMLDNPQLAGQRREPLRVILDSSLSMRLNSRVLRDKNVLIVTTKRASKVALRRFQQKKIPLKIFPKSIRLAEVLRFLGKSGVSSVLVEGGSEVFGSFIDAKLVDRFYIFIAPKIIGGRNAIPAVAGEGVSFLKNAPALKIERVGRIGEDLMIEAH